jgi:L-ascorbate metabolism protein UlaG (beta-lactamase superfamily)
MRVWVGIIGLTVAVSVAVSAETIPAQGGNIELTPIAHAGVQVEFMGKVIQLDPSNMGNYANAKKADVVLVTDVHGDHFDPPTIDRVRKADTVYVAPPVLADRFPGPTTIIRNGETKTVDGIQIQAVAAYNIKRGPAPGQLYHEKGRGNGYILTLGGKRIYFSGDTECTPEMKALTSIDVAFIAMNLPFTETPQEAAACVKAFKPKIVYAYHYRQQGLAPADKNMKDFAAALKGTPGVEVKMADFYPAPPAAAGRAGRGR